MTSPRHEQVLDALVGLVGHPLVDEQAVLHPLVLEVERGQRCPELGGKLRQVRLLERVALLAEEPVGDRDLDLRVLPCCQLEGQLVEGRVEPVGREGVVQHLVDLAGGVARGARVEHAEGGGDAVRAEDDVARGLAEPGVQVERERGVARDELGQVGRRHVRRGVT